MELLVWSLIFITSVCALIKASDWLILGLRRAARIFGVREADISLPAALIAVAMPEMGAALAAVQQGQTELAVAVVIGSSIANILLVAGLGAFSAGSLLLKSEYINTDLPLFASAVAIFCLVAADGRINAPEGILMILAFFVYAAYSYSARPRGITARDVITPELLGSAAVARIVQLLPTRLEKKLETVGALGRRSFLKMIGLLSGGGLVLVAASNFTVASLVGISDIMKISAAVTAMVALSIGTAMPEMFGGVSIIRSRKGDLTLGNLFAATAANLLLVCGAASLFSPLVFGGAILAVGLPFLAAASVLLGVAAVSQKIGAGQGILFLLLYFLFFVKLLELF